MVKKGQAISSESMDDTQTLLHSKPNKCVSLLLTVWRFMGTARTKSIWACCCTQSEKTSPTPDGRMQRSHTDWLWYTHTVGEHHLPLMEGKGDTHITTHGREWRWHTKWVNTTYPWWKKAKVTHSGMWWMLKGIGSRSSAVCWMV